MSLLTAICVVELPLPIPQDAQGGRRGSDSGGSRPPAGASSAAATASMPPRGSSSSSGPRAPASPRFVLVLPHGDPGKLDHNVLSFCFPDLDHLARAPYHYEHTSEEYVFTLTRQNGPKLHGFCRRYRVGSAAVGGRLDISPFGSVRPEDKAAPSFQCICILSEK